MQLTLITRAESTSTARAESGAWAVARGNPA